MSSLEWLWIPAVLTVVFAVAAPSAAPRRRTPLEPGALLGTVYYLDDELGGGAAFAGEAQAFSIAAFRNGPHFQWLAQEDARLRLDVGLAVFERDPERVVAAFRRAGRRLVRSGRLGAAAPAIAAVAIERLLEEMGFRKRVWPRSALDRVLRRRLAAALGEQESDRYRARARRVLVWWFAVEFEEGRA